MSGDDSARDELDELYGVLPEEFTARRKDLVAAARKRGDAGAARLIGAARRPTTAAWVVNLLVRRDETARRRLSDLADELRAAHAAMDGPRIRESTAAQRKLVDTLVRTSFAEAGLTEPSAALRDDVTGTLQAAIADPDVAARLGRLLTAERWSGFGDFGETSAVAGTSRKGGSKSPSAMASGESDRIAARKRRHVAAEEVTLAEAAQSDGEKAIADSAARLATARRRYEKLLETLSAAERDVNTAEAELDAARQSAQRSADRLATAMTELAAADATLAKMADG